MKKLTVFSLIVVTFVVSCPTNVDGHAAPVSANDWLLDPAPYKASVRQSDNDWILENGLVQRVVTINPGSATISLRCLGTGEEYCRDRKSVV